MGSDTGDGVHITGLGAHIHGCDITPPQTVDKTSERFEQCFTVVYFTGRHNHCFSTALLHTGQCSFVAHASGKADSILNSVVCGCVGEEPTTSQSSASGCVVNGNHGLQACAFIRPEMEFTGPCVFHLGKHKRDPSADFYYWKAAAVTASPSVSRTNIAPNKL